MEKDPLLLFYWLNWTGFFHWMTPKETFFLWKLGCVDETTFQKRMLLLHFTKWLKGDNIGILYLQMLEEQIA